MLWAAAWLHRATDEKTYLDFLGGSSNTGGTRTDFSWDDKYVGAQVLVSKVLVYIGIPLYQLQSFYLEKDRYVSPFHKVSPELSMGANMGHIYIWCVACFGGEGGVFRHMEPVQEPGRAVHMLLCTERQ